MPNIAKGNLIVQVPIEARPGAGARALEASPGTGTQSWVVPLPAAKNPWDAAHAAVEGHLALEGAAAVTFAEPDFRQHFPYIRPKSPLEAAQRCSIEAPDAVWPHRAEFAWHLGDSFSELRRAELVQATLQVRASAWVFSILATIQRTSLPAHLALEHAVNLTGEGDRSDATDPAAAPALESFRNPGHGTATLALLAGNRFTGVSGFDDFLGGAPQVEVVPIRIADSVVHFYSSAMAFGIEHAIAHGCDVISISMGGVPAHSWATAVNRAYEAGVVVVAASGNNVGGLPTTSMVYPARFHRVISACGATADNTPYFKGVGHPGMQGNFGPEGRMRTAMAAFTPNIAWAEIGCRDVVSWNGAGTSSATPQVAAAAALWLQAQAASEMPRTWRRAEAVRHALFSSAYKIPQYAAQFGHGLLRASQALDVAPDFVLGKAPNDDVRFPWIHLLFGLEAAPRKTERQTMLELEALQLYLTSTSLQQLVDRADPDDESLAPTQRKRLLAAMSQDPRTSATLRGLLEDVLPRL